LACVLPPLGTWGRALRPPLSGGGDIAAHAAVVALWMLLGTISIARGLRRASWLWTWLGLMLFGFASAGVLGALAVTEHDLWSTGSLAVRLLALLFVLNGVAQELKLAFLDQRSRLFDTRLSVEASEVRRRAEHAEREERAHEARSALLGIQAATRTLTSGYDEYATETQVELRDALETEIQLLRVLVNGERVHFAGEPFDVSAAVSPVVVCQRAAGRDVRAELAPAVRAFGHPAVLTEIVQALLDNARDHAPGSVVVVRAGREGDRAVVRVEDRGPGVDPEQREGIFRRGVSSSPNGSGLGLYVARRLLRDQDGDIHVEARAGGGASFVVTLPAVPMRLRDVSGAELVHHADHAGDLGDVDPFDAIVGQQ
jgi:signal transduction histidine kinase